VCAGKEKAASVIKGTGHEDVRVSGGKFPWILKLCALNIIDNFKLQTLLPSRNILGTH
jgi:hypothetical protein